MPNKLIVLPSSLLLFTLILSSVPTTGYGQSGTPTPPGTRGTATATATTIPASTKSAIPALTATPTPTPVPEPSDRFFPETGFTVPAVFMKYWNAHGGLPIFGFPISEAKMEVSLTDGKEYLVQYFERNRFEYHPEIAGTENEVLLGLLGAELTRERSFPSVQAFADQPGKVYFEETRHSLSEPFLSYWRNNGGLRIFGYPISEPFEERSQDDGKVYLVQYFQRNRFEYHPENQPPYDVLLGRLGLDYMDMMALPYVWGQPVEGGLPVIRPIWPPAKPAIGGKFLTGPHVGDGIIVQMYYQDYGRILNLVNDLRFTWIKQQVEWKNTEDPKGNYHWDELDRIVAAAERQRIKVMISVVKAPLWATGGGHGFPKDPQDLHDFMRAMAARYKGRVDAYEVWNEHNLQGESGEVNAGRYVELLKAAYTGIKASDPGAVVIAGALTPTGVNDPKGQRAPGAEGAMNDVLYLEEMYKYHDGDVRSYFDVLGTHPYGFNNPPDTKWPDNPNWNPHFPLGKDGRPDYYNRHNSFYFRRIEDQRAIMEKYGDGHKQMWVTEYGWCSDYRDDGYGECKFNTREDQGRYILGAMERSRRYYPWMGVMFLWNLNFSTFQPWYTGPSHFSIINGDWTGRPAYFMIRDRQR